jgi:myo-inositol-1-phosphate synthase
MDKIKIAVVGIGNCASALIQGIEYYRTRKSAEAIGLMHWDVGGFSPGDIETVAAYDIDRRKVGRDLAEAIFAPPNCTKIFCPQMPKTGTLVRMGKVLDGVAGHMGSYDQGKTFLVADERELEKEEIVRDLTASGAEVLLNYLPVGSEEATRFYAECALAAGVGFINNIPVFIASDPTWAQRFTDAGLPVIGDDIKSQVGATIVHRTLTNLFSNRGVRLDSTYQLNFGGNTDFLNMLDRERLQSKKLSKTEAVRCQVQEGLADERIHIGPSDWVCSQGDNKIAYIRMEGRLFGDVPMNLELRLSVEDSPNSAGVVIDAIRCLKLAKDRGIGGPLHSPSAYFMKHPPLQFTDDHAHTRTEEFIQGTRDR